MPFLNLVLRNCHTSLTDGNCLWLLVFQRNVSQVGRVQDKIGRRLRHFFHTANNLVELRCRFLLATGSDTTFKICLVMLENVLFTIAAKRVIQFHL